MNSRYGDVYARSLSDPEGFWAEAAVGVHWFKRWDRVLDADNPPFYRWFPGGQVNSCYSAIDHHVDQGRKGDVALVYDSPVTDTVRRYTFADMQDATARFAGALSKLGVGKGDRVIIYMPMVPEAVIAMLGCARLGAVHSVVFGGFASHELAVRIDDARPKVIVSGSCGIEGSRIIPYKPLLDRAIDLAGHKPDHVVMLQRPMEKASMVPGRDLDWEETMAAAPRHDCVPVESNDPLYILYTSGTTGKPKGVLRDNAGHIVALRWSMQNIYNVRPGDTYWAASDIGWVVGHSYIVYGPLFNGNTTVLYEGKPVGTPDAGAFWRVIADHGVRAMFTAPTAFRAIKKEDPDGALIGRYDLSKFDTLFLAGERADPDTVRWAEAKLQKPVIDHWWQTETAWSICANCVGLGALPVKYGSPTKPAPGYDVRVMDETGKEAPAGKTGALVVRLPLPPGSFPTLWNAPDRYVETYFSDYPGYYVTADAGFIDEDGYVYVMGRTDDVINVAGHRLSTGAMEEVLANHPDVAECAVIGVADSLKGQVPVGFLVLKAGVTCDAAALQDELVQMVRNEIGPVASFRQAAVVARLPKTRSGKILRGTMQKIADGEDYVMPATIDDDTVLDEIAEALRALGYAKDSTPQRALP